MLKEALTLQTQIIIDKSCMPSALKILYNFVSFVSNISVLCAN